MKSGIVYMVGVVGVVTVLAAIGFAANYQSGSESLTWGPAQTAQVSAISYSAGNTVYTVVQPSGAFLAIEVKGTCGDLTIRSMIVYRVSSGINPATGTQSIQILNPLGCVTVSFGG